MHSVSLCPPPPSEGLCGRHAVWSLNVGRSQSSVLGLLLVFILLLVSSPIAMVSKVIYMSVTPKSQISSLERSRIPDFSIQLST